MVMPYYEGPTLKAALQHSAAPPDEATIRDWLRSLLDALSAIHRENCYHRDISPDNILLTESGPLLLDFGAARRVITDRTQVLTAMLKPGFAPIEQYGGLIMQGPWTDLYALAGVVHYAITGRPPVPSAERVVNDTQLLLAVSQAGRYDASLLRAVDAGLAVLPAARPQDVEAFRKLLNEGLAEDSPLRLATPKLVSLSRLPEAPTAAEPVVEVPLIANVTEATPTPPAPSDAPASTHAATPRHFARWLFASIALCLAAGMVYWWPRATVMPPPPTATPVSAAPAAKPLAPTPVAEPRMTPTPDKPPPAGRSPGRPAGSDRSSAAP